MMHSAMGRHACGDCEDQTTLSTIAIEIARRILQHQSPTKRFEANPHELKNVQEMMKLYAKYYQ
jgi:hypothetical protein